MKIAGALFAGVLGLTGVASGRTAAIAVRLEETARTAALYVRLPEGGDPETVEVQLDGPWVTVLARDRGGRLLRSERIRLRRPAVEDGAQVVRAPGGTLTIVLRKPRRSAAPSP